MLHLPQTAERPDWLGPPPAPAEPSAFGWIPDVLGFLRRQWLVIAGIAVTMTALALAYALTARPLFTATTRLLIDTEQANPFQSRAVVAESQAENALVESQVEVLRSEEMARTVVERLDLAQHPAFLPHRDPAQGGIGVAAENLQRNLEVRRIGLSYVIEISARSPDPQLSARIANAVTAAYFEDQLQARQALTQRASGWLEQRLAELRDQALAADRAVQEYKVQNNIVGTERGLVNEQQLAELTSQMAAARSRLTEAQARLERVQTLSASGVMEGTVGEALQNAVIVRLRQQYLDASRREAEFAGRYGANHVAAVNLRAEMAELQRNIQNELSRIRAATGSDVEVARTSLTAIERQFAQQVGVTADTNESRIMLRALEQAAETYRSIYSNFLQRYTQVVQDQSFPITNARVIEEARPPRRKSHPRSAIILAGGLVAGLGLGFGVGFLREALQRGVRTSAQLRAATGLEVLGVVPYRRTGILRRRRARPTFLNDPDGRVGEALWGVKLRADHAGLRILGCVAAHRGEGATTAAAALARTLARAGQRVVLVDLDLREARLTERMAGETPTPGLTFQSAPSDADPADALRLTASAETRHRLQNARDQADYVVVDLPPALEHVDAAALAEALDALVLVVEWGRTDSATVLEAAERIAGAKGRVLGTLLNKAPLARNGRIAG